MPEPQHCAILISPVYSTPKVRNIMDAIAAIVSNNGFRVSTCYGDKATEENIVETAVQCAAQMQGQPKTALLIYCGHGRGDLTDDQGKDQSSWELHDRKTFLGDAIWKLLAQEFPEEAPVIVISDSCYSGGLKKLLLEALLSACLSGHQWDAQPEDEHFQDLLQEVLQSVEAIRAQRDELALLPEFSRPKRILSSGPAVVTPATMLGTIATRLKANTTLTYDQLLEAVKVLNPRAKFELGELANKIALKPIPRKKANVPCSSKCTAPFVTTSQNFASTPSEASPALTSASIAASTSLDLTD